MPPDTTYWCDYIEAWSNVKERWLLTSSTEEIAKIDSVEARCEE